MPRLTRLALFFHSTARPSSEQLPRGRVICEVGKCEKIYTRSLLDFSSYRTYFRAGTPFWSDLGICEIEAVHKRENHQEAVCSAWRTLIARRIVTILVTGGTG